MNSIMLQLNMPFRDKPTTFAPQFPFRELQIVTQVFN